MVESQATILVLDLVIKLLFNSPFFDTLPTESTLDVKPRLRELVLYLRKAPFGVDCFEQL